MVRHWRAVDGYERLRTLVPLPLPENSGCAELNRRRTQAAENSGEAPSSPTLASHA